jgi:hypothetical protein
MGLTLFSQPAQAVFVTVNSTQYDVTTFTGTYDANTSKFATPANGGLMPWYGNQTLAEQFALAVYNLTPTNGGLADNSVSGPFFASSASWYAAPSGSLGVLMLITTSAVSMSADYQYSGYPVGQVYSSGFTGPFDTPTYATATAVPWETDALPVIGSTLLFAGGVWTKRKSVKSLDKE